MSTRTFCDSCGTEICDRNRATLATMKSTKGGVQFNIVRVGFNEENEGDVCRYCVYDAIRLLYDLYDRPREVEATNA